jgi:hypothetical protein
MWSRIKVRSALKMPQGRESPYRAGNESAPKKTQRPSLVLKGREERVDRKDKKWQERQQGIAGPPYRETESKSSQTGKRVSNGCSESSYSKEIFWQRLQATRVSMVVSYMVSREVPSDMCVNFRSAH